MSRPVTLNDALEEIEHLKRELGQVRDRDRVGAFAARWGLSSKEASVLDILYVKRGAIAAKTFIMDVLYARMPDEPDMKIVDVFVCKIRKKVGKDRIGTQHGLGYFLTPAGLVACQQVVEATLPKAA